LFKFQGIYNYNNISFNDDFIPYKNKFKFFSEIKYIVRTLGAKRNVNYITSKSVVEFKPKTGIATNTSMINFDEAIRTLRIKNFNRNSTFKYL
jgi:hypothetical protein